MYQPTESSKKAGEKALAQLIETFFHGSPRSLMATLLDTPQAHFGQEDLRQLRHLIELRMAGSAIDSLDT